MKELTWSLIGGGSVCEKKGGPPLYRLDGCRLAGITRRDREAGEDFSRRHGPCRYYATYDELLAESAIDAVYVATPPDLHAQNTAAAAAAGKHVLCEKPMAMNAGQCRGMIDTCRQHGVILAVAYYRRCYPSIQRAKALVDAGVVGDLQILHINDEFPASHRLDLVHYLCGDIAHVRVRRETLPEGSHAREGPALHAVARAGPEAIMPVSWRETGAPETMEIIGEAGRILIKDLKGGHLVLETDGKQLSEVFPPFPATHWGLVENFREHFREGTPLACDGEEGRKSSVILDIVSALGDDGGESTVDYAKPPDMDRVRASGLRLLE